MEWQKIKPGLIEEFNDRKAFKEALATKPESLEVREWLLGKARGIRGGGLTTGKHYLSVLTEGQFYELPSIKTLHDELLDGELIKAFNHYADDGDISDEDHVKDADHPDENLWQRRSRRYNTARDKAMKLLVEALPQIRREADAIRLEILSDLVNKVAADRPDFPNAAAVLAKFEQEEEKKKGIQLQQAEDGKKDSTVAVPVDGNDAPGEAKEVEQADEPDNKETEKRAKEAEVTPTIRGTVSEDAEKDKEGIAADEKVDTTEDKSAAPEDKAPALKANDKVDIQSDNSSEISSDPSWVYRRREREITPVDEEEKRRIAQQEALAAVLDDIAVVFGCSEDTLFPYPHFS